MYIECDSCRIKDVVDLVRCFKCQGDDHVAKHYTTGRPVAPIAQRNRTTTSKNKEKSCRSNCKCEGRVDSQHIATPVLLLPIGRE